MTFIVAKRTRYPCEAQDRGPTVSSTCLYISAGKRCLRRMEACLTHCRDEPPGRFPDEVSCCCALTDGRLPGACGATLRPLQTRLLGRPGARVRRPGLPGRPYLYREKAHSAGIRVFLRVHLQCGEEGRLRDFYFAELTHALFAFLLLFQQLALAADVATVTFCRHIL